MMKVSVIALVAAVTAAGFTLADAAALELGAPGEPQIQSRQASSHEVTAQAPAPARAGADCRRKVKVVYPGLGEIHRAPCVIAAE